MGVTGRQLLARHPHRWDLSPRPASTLPTTTTVAAGLAAALASCPTAAGVEQQLFQRRLVHGDRHPARVCNLHGRQRGDGDRRRGNSGANGTTCVHNFSQWHFCPGRQRHYRASTTALRDCATENRPRLLQRRRRGYRGGTVTGSSFHVTDNRWVMTPASRLPSTKTGTSRGAAVDLWEQRDGKCLRHPHRWDLSPRWPQHLTHHLDCGIRTDHGPRYVRRQYGCWL